MATTFVDYTGDGNATKAFSFPSIQESDVKVDVDGVVKSSGTHYNITGYTTTGGGSVVFTSGNIPVSPQLIRIFRDTDVDSAKATYTAGSSIKADDLNANHEQLLFAAQEEQNQTIQTQDIKDGAITSAKILDGTIATGDIAADAITNAKIADDSIDSEHYVDGSIDTAHIADLQVTTGKIAADAITSAKLADDSINSEHYVDGSIDTVHIADDAVTADKLANSINAEIAANTAKTTNQTHTGDVTGSVALTIATGAVNSAKIADGAIVNDDVNASAAIAHSKLAAVPDGQVIVGNSSTVPTAVAISGDVTLANDGAVTIANNAVEIGMLGCEQTTITDSDSHIPTSGAVVDYVAAQLEPFGGFEVIADEDNFPTSMPASGVVISITDAAGVVFNGSGVSTTARTAGNGSDNVTINNAPSSLYNETLASGVGLQVVSTGSSNTYNFHRIIPTPADTKQLSDDINDFFARYRINAGEPSSNNDTGDLVFDTNASKMKVYDGSSWGEVTSTGDFKFLFLCPAGGTGAPTLDGSIATYDLRESSNSGAAASVTSAAQLLVSVNGVIQKPNTGTSAPAEGFAMVDTNTIIFGANLASGDSVFIIQIGSAVTIPTPGDNTVTSAKIVDGAIVNADINASADIAGSKLADDSITEAKLDIHNAPSGTDKFLKYSSNGLEWAVPSYTTNTDTQLSTEQVQDIVGAMFTGNTETNITATYEDSDGTIDLVSTDTNTTDLVTDTSPQLGGDLDTNSFEINLDDAHAINFGDSQDAEIKHTGSNFTIRNTEGNIRIEPKNGELGIQIVPDANVSIYYDNSKKFESTSTGATITGSITTTTGAAFTGVVSGNLSAATSATTITLDLGAANYHTVTLAHNTTFADPSNEVAGQSGSIIITQDGTGSRTASWNSAWKWAAGTAPTLSTAAGAVDRIDFLVVAAGNIHAVASLDVK